ncbi:MAG: response regulator [Planctomycetota bacterium]
MNHAPKRILIVDDDADIRENLSDILSDMGYQTTCAHDGASTLELVRNSEFEVALLDYRMPDMNGVTLYQQIKKLRPSMAAILITAWAGSRGASEARDEGTWDVFRKPVDMQRLLDRIDDVIQAPLILVVDDDHEFCDSLWQILNERDCRVSIAYNESQAIEQLQQQTFQIAIVDLKLGEDDGRAVIERIAQSTPQAKTVLVSGHANDAQHLIDSLGAARVHLALPKPVDIDQLLAAIAIV